MIRTAGDHPHARRPFLPRKRNGADGRTRWLHEGSRSQPFLKVGMYNPARFRTRSKSARFLIKTHVERDSRIPLRFPGIYLAATLGIRSNSTRDRHYSLVTLGRGACRDAVPNSTLSSCRPPPLFPPFHFSFVLFVGRAVRLRPQTRLNWSDPRTVPAHIAPHPPFATLIPDLRTRTTASQWPCSGSYPRAYERYGILRGCAFVRKKKTEECIQNNR